MAWAALLRRALSLVLKYSMCFFLRKRAFLRTRQ